MFKLAELVHNFDGIDFFIRLEDIPIKDQVLKAYIQNIKSKSFYISVQNYPTVINDLMCYWTKQFVKNDETLGLKILKAKSLFFDYIKSYQEFLVSTSYSNDENAVYDFYNQQYDQEYEKSQDICKAAWDTLLK